VTRERSFVLVPGAGGSAWYWHRLVDELVGRGHRALAVALPAADPDSGLSDYGRVIADAIRSVQRPVTLVAQSLGGFSAPLACTRVAVEDLVLLNAMIPLPGETAGEWWADVGWEAAAQEAARREGRPPVDLNDVATVFFHDLPEEIVAFMESNPDAAQESGKVFGEPWPLDRWPEVPTTVLAGAEDRLFPVDLQRRVARERLGLPVEVVPGGHLAALSQPVSLAAALCPEGAAG